MIPLYLFFYIIAQVDTDSIDTYYFPSISEKVEALRMLKSGTLTRRI